MFVSVNRVFYDMSISLSYGAKQDDHHVSGDLKEPSSSYVEHVTDVSFICYFDRNIRFQVDANVVAGSC